MTRVLGVAQSAERVPVEHEAAGSNPVAQPKTRRTLQDGGTEWLCEHCECDLLFEPHAPGCPAVKPVRAIAFQGP